MPFFCARPLLSFDPDPLEVGADLLIRQQLLECIEVSAQLLLSIGAVNVLVTVSAYVDASRRHFLPGVALSKPLIGMALPRNQVMESKRFLLFAEGAAGTHEFVSV